jgi:hypothetical protein
VGPVTAEREKPASEDQHDDKEDTAITLPKESTDTSEPVFELISQQKRRPVYKSRMFKMFGVLVLLFSQYLLFFDGNQKINQAYGHVAATFQDLLGD